jgi:cyclopropane fatty-acyl-phospholipid synthase-like methyltransferase
MKSWTSGYVADIDYTHGYYRETSPVFLSYALLHRCVSHSDGRPLRYLDLGFGQGVSLNFHAAACSGEFWGTDFNPSHAANAKELAQASGSGARVYDMSFQELREHEDLPEFDVIVLHGIWSWISQENRTAIVDLARRKLAVGGILYISYNCTPGWSAAMPLRHLMTLYAGLAVPDDKGVTAKIDDSLKFAEQMVEAGALYFRANPSVAEKLKALTQQNRKYLAHEYFNSSWDPLPFSDIATKLADAKLDFAASTNLLEHMDQLNLTKEGQALLAGLHQPILRESMRDYLLNQQFRRDIFIRGHRPMNKNQWIEQYRLQRFSLLTHAEKASPEISGPTRGLRLNEEMFRRIVEISAENDYAPKSVAEIHAHRSWKSGPIEAIMEVVSLLTASGQMHPAQSNETIESAKSRCQALNLHICERARYGGEIGYLASPVIGGGVQVEPLEKFFLLARHNGHSEPKGWASFTWDILNAQGQKMVKDGQVLNEPEDNRLELERRAKQFESERLPVLRAIGIA